MRIFVGTLYSGENEYEECLLSIRAQGYKSYQHFIFKDLPNKQAHVTLFSSFLERSNEFDLLIKVDADMVLADDNLFGKIVQKMENNPWMDLFAVAVHDFFSNQLIWGLNSYRTSVRWNFAKDTIFVDIPEVPQDRILFDTTELAPAAIHCKNPSLYQAFHYGIHRGLKSLQDIHAKSHWDLLTRMLKNFQRTKDVRIGLACLGVELAYANLFEIKDLDYTNPGIKTILQNYALFDAVQLDREIKKRRLANWGMLPGGIRRRILRYRRHRAEP